MDKMTPAYARVTNRPLPPTDGDNPCVQSTLSQTLGLLEKRLYEAVERAARIDARIMPALVMKGECDGNDTDSATDAALPTAERCAGLANRLHLVLNGLESNIG